MRRRCRAPTQDWVPASPFPRAEPLPDPEMIDLDDDVNDFDYLN